MKKINVEVFNVKGQKLVDCSQQFSKPIDLSKLKNGTYYLKVNDGVKTYSKIFEVMK
jgi:hypothetical protein